MRKHKRIVAAILTLILVTMIAMAAAATVTESGHACTGIDCDICRVITMVSGIIRSIAATAVIYILLCMCVLTAARAINKTDHIPGSDPVSDKTKLLN